MTSPKFNTCSPRPIPQFFNDFNILTTKKERYSSTPVKRKIPPRPPSKSVSQISRLSCTLNNTQKAQIISFREDNQPQLSQLYDETLRDSYFKQCFIIEDKIGSGSFGDVYKVKCKENGKYYAIKVSREKFKGKLDREERLNEVFKHEQLPNHDHLVNLHRAWEEKQRLYIQSELCAMSLSTLAENNHDIPEDMVWCYLVDLLKALDHIHSYNLIHLDIKPENIFISEDGLCKLGDFGLILDINNHRYNDATEGDPKYLASELMQGVFTKSADIFSLGMTILELASDLDLPSRGDGWHMLRSGNIPASIFSDMSCNLKEIITMMLCPDYALRPTARELLLHPVVAKHEKRRRYQLKLKKILTFLQHIQKTICNSFINICSYVNILMSPLTNYFGNLFPQKPTDNSANLNSSPNINHQRNYITSYLDQYSDDEAADNRQNSNSSLDLSFTDDEIFNDNTFSNRNLCSTINRNAQPNNFLITQLSPLLNVNQNGGDNIESIKVRLTFDEFSSDEMELTENEEEGDEFNSSSCAQQRPSIMSSIRAKPNISRKNLMQTFDEIDLDSSNT